MITKSIVAILISHLSLALADSAPITIVNKSDSVGVEFTLGGLRQILHPKHSLTVGTSTTSRLEFGAGSARVSYTLLPGTAYQFVAAGDTIRLEQSKAAASISEIDIHRADQYRTKLTTVLAAEALENEVREDVAQLLRVDFAFLDLQRSANKIPLADFCVAGEKLVVQILTAASQSLDDKHKVLLAVKDLPKSKDAQIISVGTGASREDLKKFDPNPVSTFQQDLERLSQFRRVCGVSSVR